MFDATIRDGVFQLRRSGTRWLSTGPDGGFSRADAAYNVSVPEGWACEDLSVYVTERRERAGFDAVGPALLTGVELRHVRGARLDPVVAYATVGVSNPAALPMAGSRASDADSAGAIAPGSTDGPDPDEGPGVGTVNVLVGTARALEDAALANLVAVVAEAKAVTLHALSGFPGTTTDAVVVATDADGVPERYSGSATPVGGAARACVRDAVRASFRSRYADRTVPESVADAEHGVVTDERAEVFEV